MIDTPDHKISFERVKNIVVGNVECGHATYAVFNNGTGSVLAVKRYLERRAPFPNTLETLSKIRNELAKYVRSADVRCVNELIALVPQGADSRLPRWLYCGVVAELGDNGWMLYPKNVESSEK